MYGMRRLPQCSTNRGVYHLIFGRNISIYDKGKAEENIFMLKRQQEELMKLKKKIKEHEQLLDRKIDETEKVIKEMEDSIGQSEAPKNRK